MTIVQSTSQILEKKIHVGGYEMNLTPCRRFINSCKAKIEDDIPYILYTVEQTLTRKDVADRLLNEVRIGSSAVIVDEVNNYTYFIQCDIEDIYLMDIQDHRFEPLDPQPYKQVMMVVNTRGLKFCA